MCNLSNASSLINGEMKEVHDLVQHASRAKENLVTAKQLLGEDHPLAQQAQHAYTQSVHQAMGRYQTMANHITTYMDTVLA